MDQALFGKSRKIKVMKSFLGGISLLFFVCVACAGCKSMIRSATQPMIDNLSASIMKQNDLDLVKDGAPAFLLIIDGMVQGSPDDPQILMAAAQMYSAYVSAFVLDENPERAKLMSQKARHYAFSAMSLKNETFARVHDKPFVKFVEVVPTIEKGDEELLFLVISTWASYIQAHSGNWDNVADIAKVEVLTKRLLELDETYYYGSAHLVMGVLKTLLPAALGGKPEEAKVHFERAIEISEGRFLQAKVMYASRYAKLTFNRELHDKLLREVLETPADVISELTLVNTMAKKQAEKLLAEADEYF